MIITCPSCNKSFEIEEDLIPDNGRTLQCGSCSYKWYFNKEKKNEKNYLNEEVAETSEKKIKESIPEITTKNEGKIVKKTQKTLSNEIDKIINKKDKALVKYEKMRNFTFGNFLSYMIVAIISLIAIIIVLDTFKIFLEKIFPNLELILFNLYETLKDIQLFMKDLTQ